MRMKTKILFLCTGNSCRSQIAEGFARHLKADVIESYSAGTHPKGMNPLAVEVMKEVGIDISRQQSKHIDEFKGISFDYVVTLCEDAQETCPFFPGKLIHHGFDDPPKLAENAKTDEEKLVHYRSVRNEIAEFIVKLPEILTKSLSREDKSWEKA